MKYLFSFGLTICSFIILAQQRPFVNNIDKTSGAVGETVSISGSGFSPGNMQVNFGSGIAVITNATTTLIEVTVPSSATYGPVLVLDKSTGLSGASSQAFTPSFSGSGFEVTSVGSQFDFTTGQQYTYDLCACDFDGDGLKDVAVANNTGTSVSIFKNASTLTTPSFTRTNIANGFSTISTECGDLNGDGLPDLVFTSNQEIISIYTNNSTAGTISFTRNQFILPKQNDGNIRNPKRFKIIDIDGDGKNDLVVGNETDNIIFIYRNISTGATITFDTPVSITVTGAVHASGLDAGDINGNGLNDIVTISAAQNDFVYVLQNESSPGVIKMSQQVLSNTSTRLNVILADLNMDGKKDIVTTSSVSDEIDIFLNSSTINTVSFEATPITISNTQDAWGLEAADLDGDGLTDLAVTSTSGGISILENTTTGGTLSFDVKTISTNGGNRNITVFDINGDAKPDFATTNRSDATSFGNLTVLLNQNCLAPTIGPSDLTFCVGNAFTLSATRSLQTTYNWSVSAGDATINTNGSRTTSVTVNSGTNATIQVTITANDGSCTDVGTQTFTLTGGTPPPAPTIINSTSGVICAGDPFTLTATANRDEYLWTLPDGTETTRTTNTLEIASASSVNAGIYQLRVLQAGSCVSEVGSISVSVDEPPTVGIFNNGADDFCETTTVELEVPSYSGFGFQWKRNGTDISGANSNTFVASLSGDYTVAVISDASGCDKESSAYTLNAVTLPVSNFSSVDEICVGVAIDFSVTSTGQNGFDLQYEWDFGDGTTDDQPTTTHTYNTPGTYDVTLSTSYETVESCADDFTKTITISDIPEVDIILPEGSEKCPLDSLRLELPQNYISYNWSTGDTSYFTYAKTAANEEDVTITVDMVTNLGCEVQSEVTVSNYANSRVGITTSEATIVDDTVNLADGVSTISLKAQNGSSYNWEPSEILDNTTSETVTAYPRERYTTISLTGPDAVNGCETTATLVIETPGVIARKTFSPNGDGLGYDCWEILNTNSLEGCTVYIVDQRGAYVFKGSSPFQDNCVWNGNLNNGSTQVPEGIYYFIMKCDNSRYNMTGSILLAR